jgi:hypothetical protein
MQERDAAADTGFRGGEKHAAIENIAWNSSDGREEFTAGTIHCCTIHCFGNLVTRAVSMDMAASETRGTNLSCREQAVCLTGRAHPKRQSWRHESQKVQILIDPIRYRG